MRTMEDIKKDMDRQLSLIRFYNDCGQSGTYCNSDSMGLRDAYEAYEKYRREYVVASQQHKRQA